MSPSQLSQLSQRRRSDYGFHLDYRTRWADNDMYDHLNNSVYSYLFDSIINAYLIQHCSLHPPTSKLIGLVIFSQCNFFGSVSFPCSIDLGLAVSNLGNSSVTYEIGLFEQGIEDVRAVGSYTHVFVERKNSRPSPDGMPDTIRNGLEKLRRPGKPKL